MRSTGNKAGTQHSRLNEAEIRSLLRGEEDALCRMTAHYKGLICFLCHTYACQQGIKLNEEETKDLLQSVVIKLVTGQLWKFKI